MSFPDIPRTVGPLGDMPAEEFRAAGHALVDWIAEYLATAERYPVMSQVEPGALARALPASAPLHGEPIGVVLDDVERQIVPALTHWNSPTFFGYFSICASGPGILADFLSSALNQQAMLWRTSPAATELEAVSLSWLRQLMGLPATFEGVIYDTASISTLHALAAARERALPGVRRTGLEGREDAHGLRVYCSDQAHSSVDKAVILLGLGHDAVVRIPSDEAFRMRPEALAARVAADRAAGLHPLAVVATTGTTSTTSVDPVAAIADVCQREGLWLHVDAAYGGAAALLPEMAWVLEGADRADSLVVNPHKWMLTPFDLSVLFCRHMDLLREAFSLVPEYLRTSEAPEVRNLMDTGVQLGRRFRSLKLWFVLRYFGADGMRTRIAEHVRLASLLAGWVDADPAFERVAPTPMSVVCFRARPESLQNDPAALDTLNERLLLELNAGGRIFLSHTKLRDAFVLRFAIGHARTTESHVADAWALIRTTAASLI
ncbi:aromatic-L-amino-acid decarboxylase [Luteitalea sp. TBR-22]|uniref:pyridoxal phosphate-dependent decarboxylase family protein n=1 Tax=Luteitalea sp. TBR-22 TaxID=2802971 RepID=UPI001AF6B870|nr:pyridoxal-dependent decarboxylase [Luteitalea sp. TBR-22]BCS35845.1 aromatic-L-amino-acid decarboxylase [Luteitalea sp. TBR-22]